MLPHFYYIRHIELGCSMSTHVPLLSHFQPTFLILKKRKEAYEIILLSVSVIVYVCSSP
jgi:hypothetical protein